MSYIIRPTANGDTIEMTPTPGARANYDCVNEVILDPADFVSALNGAMKSDLYVMEDLPVLCPDNCGVVLRFQGVTQGDFSMYSLVKIGGVLYTQLFGWYEGGGTAFREGLQLEISPATGVGWTRAEINGAQFGLKIDPWASNDVDIRQFWVEVYPAPLLQTDAATNVDITTATLNGTVNDDRDNSCYCGFDYGLDTGYGDGAGWDTRVEGAFSAGVAGLSAATVYHFRVRGYSRDGVGWNWAQNRQVSPTVYGDDKTFQTLPLVPPPPPSAAQSSYIDPLALLLEEP